ncbi:MAG TPA: hypothetical protein VGA89_00475 [Patescibacteria group bacterium]|jgi:hypothetical protein
MVGQSEKPNPYPENKPETPGTPPENELGQKVKIKFLVSRAQVAEFTQVIKKEETKLLSVNYDDDGNMIYIMAIPNRTPAAIMNFINLVETMPGVKKDSVRRVV